MKITISGIGNSKVYIEIFVLYADINAQLGHSQMGSLRSSVIEHPL